MKKHIILLSFFGMLFHSCMDEPVIQPNSYEGNFNALWEIIDTKYCYLDYKNIDWDSIYTAYHQRIPYIKTDLDFFDFLGKMLEELKDGHVNLYSGFDVSRYWKWYTDYPENFSSDIIYSDRYLGENYRIAGGMHYQKIDNGNIGYIYYGDFTSDFSDANIGYIFKYFSNCKGIILDVRNNGGGYMSGAEQLASYFFTEKTLTGYLCHKTGPGHTDFSTPIKLFTPANKNVQWLRPVVILTNRMTYSATNDFVNRMRKAPYAIILGDKTGGGGGMPLSSEIPNGWMVRVPTSPMFDANMQHIEWGIDPDINIALKPEDAARGYDTLIERAVALIKFL